MSKLTSEIVTEILLSNSDVACVVNELGKVIAIFSSFEDAAEHADACRVRYGRTHFVAPGESLTG